MRRRSFRRRAEHEPARAGERPSEPADEPRADSDEAAGTDGGATSSPEENRTSGPEENRRRARVYLIAAAHAAVLIPALCYLKFGEINAYGLSFTVFMVVLCLLVALGYYFADRPVQQTTTPPSAGGLPGRVGAFWLVACAFGPFFGWLVTAPEFPVTEGDWWWRYAARAALSVGLPVLTALPLLVYVRGRRWYVALLLLLCVTSLAAWSGVNTVLDLREGPVAERATGFYDAPHNSFYPAAVGQAFKLTTLAHTQRTIKIEPAPPDER